MEKTFNVIIEKDSEGYYIASVPGLPGCYTQGDTLDETLELIKDAIRLHLADDSDLDMPEFLGVEQVSITASP